MAATDCRHTEYSVYMLTETVKRCAGNADIADRLSSDVLVMLILLTQTVKRCAGNADIADTDCQAMCW